MNVQEQAGGIIADVVTADVAIQVDAAINGEIWIGAAATTVFVFMFDA